MEFGANMSIIYPNIMSQRIYLRLKISDQNTKKLKIRFFKIKTEFPSLCLFDAIYGVWRHFVNYISLYYVPNNLFEAQNY